MRGWLLWFPIVALLAATLVLASCAPRHPNLLCRIVVSQTAGTALLCVPTLVNPKDGET